MPFPQNNKVRQPEARDPGTTYGKSTSIMLRGSHKRGRIAASVQMTQGYILRLSQNPTLVPRDAGPVPTLKRQANSLDTDDRPDMDNEAAEYNAAISLPARVAPNNIPLGIIYILPCSCRSALARASMSMQASGPRQTVPTVPHAHENIRVAWAEKLVSSSSARV